jgi:hypothetical protein
MREVRTTAVAKKKANERRVARLRRRLDRLTAQETRRGRKLARTQERRHAVEAKLRDLQPAPPVEVTTPGGSTTGVAVAGYCLRERRRVTIVDATPVVLRNGRAAMAGTCPECGVRIVSMGSPRA